LLLAGQRRQGHLLGLQLEYRYSPLAFIFVISSFHLDLMELFWLKKHSYDMLIELKINLILTKGYE